MVNLSSAKYNELVGTHECDCGKKHTFFTKCKLERGSINRLSAFLSDFTPFLSRIAVLYSSEEYLSPVLGAIKRDYRVAPIKVDDCKLSLERLELPEDTKLILAVGEVTDGAKYKAKLCDLPLVVVAPPRLSTLSPVCVVHDELPAAFSAPKPLGFFFDPELGGDIASLFGTVASSLNTSLEYYASSILSGTEYCPQLYGAMSDIAAKVILAASKCEQSSPALFDMLAQSALKLSLIASTSPALSFGGESMCAYVYARLNEETSVPALRFVFAAVLSSLYFYHVGNRRSFVAPPDNNYRLEQISELFSVAELKALKGVRRQLSGFEAALAEYRLREYSPDFIERLSKNVSLYKLAFRSFKRLSADDGYSLRELVGPDLSLSLALAPDLIDGEGMLTTLKRLGELDRYIV